MRIALLVTGLLICLQPGNHCTVALLPGEAEAEPCFITGVQPFALDQPRVPAYLTAIGSSLPLSVYVEEIEQRVFAFDAFLDTGSRRIVLSKADSVALKVKESGQEVEDIGIGGKETFDVSAPYELHVGDSDTNLMQANQFSFRLACVLQLRRTDPNPLDALPATLTQSLRQEAGEAGMDADDLGSLLSLGVNIIGMPLIRECIAVLDPRPVLAALTVITGGVGEDDRQTDGDDLDRVLTEAEKLGQSANQFGRMRVKLLRSGDIYPTPTIVVPLTMVDMDPGKHPVTKADVPFVSGVVLNHGVCSARGSFLVDTGGGVSLLSPKLAAKLGLNLAAADFEANVQGVGNAGTGLRGYWVDQLAVPAARGRAIVYKHVPLCVADIAEIDGSIGMNLLGPSVFLNLSALYLSHPLEILRDMRVGPLPFSRIVIDIPRRQLGLDPA